MIDGSGKFLIPGLWDMHAHFTHDQSTLDLCVAHGVTTVRDMGSLAVKRDGDGIASLPRDDAIKLGLQVRDEIIAGKRTGPRIYSVGMIITGGTAADAPMHHIVVETPEAARAAVNKLADLGVDAIKVHARLSRESFFAIVEEAGKRKLPVVGHTPLALDPVEVSDAGQETIEHHTGIWEYAHKNVPKGDEEQARQRYAQEYATFKKNKTAMVPTLVSYLAGAESFGYIEKPESNPHLGHVVPEMALRWKQDWPKSEFSAEQSRNFYNSVKILQEMTKAMHEQGVTILAGTDVGGIFTYPGLDLHRELKLLVDAGLSPMDVLRSATILPAETAGAMEASGSISAGKIADLVLLRADPLQNIENAAQIEMVVLRGRVLDRSELEGLRRAVAERARPTLDILQRVPWLVE
jgi:imidazolonepropionase-like amidohydrolase